MLDKIFRKDRKQIDFQQLIKLLRHFNKNKQGEDFLMGSTKFCKHCGEQIDQDCVVCPKCGKQVEELKTNDKNIIINNSASAVASVNAHTIIAGLPKNKWIALLLCIFTVCGHKFYEGKFFMGIVYLITAGLFGIGWIIDIIAIACKPNPYYV